MQRLIRALFFSSLFAFVSTLFLFSGYVRNVVAYEPHLGAAYTEVTEEFVEIVILDRNTTQENIVPLDEDQSQYVEEQNQPQSSPAITPTQKIVIPVADKDTEVKLLKQTRIPDEPVPNAQMPVRELAYQIHTLTNEARAQHNRTKYVYDETLAQLARERSEDMLRRNYFSHTEPDGCGISCHFENSGYASLVWGENIAKYEPYNTKTSDTVAEIFIERWQKSSGHRENLLSQKFTHEGIGVEIDGEEIIVTVIFARPE